MLVYGADKNDEVGMAPGSTRGAQRLPFTTSREKTARSVHVESFFTMLNVRNGTGITAIFNFGSRLSVYDSLPLGPKGNVKSRSSSLRSVKPARESAVRMSEHEIHSRVLDHVFHTGFRAVP